MLYLFKVATASLFPVHHIVKDGDHHVSQIRLRNQCHLEKRADHSRDEVKLVFSFKSKKDKLTQRDGRKTGDRNFTLDLFIWTGNNNF